MELKEYFKIIQQQKGLFLAIVVLLPLAVFAYFTFLPISFDASLTLNITRSGSQISDSYKYDDYYRLQADEKFVETIVEWIKSPRTEEDIYIDSKIDTSNYSLKKLAGSIKAEKRSSQIVAINFSAPDQETARRIAISISKIISQNIQNLNKDQKEINWFEIVSGEPVIRQNKISSFMVLVVFFGTIFLAFFSVLFRHYLK
ncbi:MAG: hypothetical protein WAV31_03950 [Candidatus Moraniibacteriota bacterium]